MYASVWLDCEVTLAGAGAVGWLCASRERWPAGQPRAASRVAVCTTSAHRVGGKPYGVKAQLSVGVWKLERQLGVGLSKGESKGKLRRLLLLRREHPGTFLNV